MPQSLFSAVHITYWTKLARTAVPQYRVYQKLSGGKIEWHNRVSLSGKTETTKKSNYNDNVITKNELYLFYIPLFYKNIPDLGIVAKNIVLLLFIDSYL